MTLLLLYAALALGVSFICSLLEAGLLSLPQSHIETLAEAGSPTADQLRALKANIDRPLSAILTLNTVAHTVGAAGVGAQAAVAFGSAWVGLASAVMTFAILVFSEIIPKTLGVVHTRGLAGLTARLTRGMVVLCYPLILVLEWVNRLIGYQRHRDRTSRMEVLATIRLGLQGGSIARREHRVATNVLALRTVRLSEIMTPRTVVFALPAEATVGQVLAEHETLHFGRIPIYEGAIDRVVGYVHRFEIYKAAAEDRHDLPLIERKRPLLTIPELATVSDAMEQMLAQSEHIALLVDEYGGTSGIITLEDLLETLLGEEIVDETDLVTDMQALAKRRRREGAP